MVARGGRIIFFYKFSSIQTAEVRQGSVKAVMFPVPPTNPQQGLLDWFCKTLTDWFGRDAGDYREWWDVFGDDCPGADGRSGTKVYTRHNDPGMANPDIMA